MASGHEYGSMTMSFPSPDEGLKDDVTAIRTLLLAAAKKFNVEIPKDIPLTVNQDALKLQRDAYDEAATEAYLRKQHITAETLQSNAWRQFISSLDDMVLDGDAPPLEALVKLRTSSFQRWDNAGPIDKLEYKTSGHRPSGADEYVYNYDSQGRVYGGVGNSWAARLFGKEWILHLLGPIPPELLALIVCELCSDTELSWDCQLRRGLVARFLNIHRAQWSISSDCFDNCRFEYSHIPQGHDLILQYHMRFFSTARLPSVPGRASGNLSVPRNRQTLEIKEGRISTILKTTCIFDLPVFTLITLADDDTEYQDATEEDAWRSTGIKSLIRGTGVSVFALRIHSCSKAWARHWSTLLDAVDKAVRVEIGHILSKEERRRIMYDSAGTGFELSEFYFTALQLLRIADEWIQQTMDELAQLAEMIQTNYSQRGWTNYSPEKPWFLPDNKNTHEALIAVSDRNWHIVTSHQQRLGKDLQSRIAKKQAELESLRDGLFNATSVAEATKSTQLNHYILVFTVVTIFYLPLGFVTALFALDLFSWDEPGQKTSFIATMVVVACMTYAFASVFIWVVRKEERRHSIGRFKAYFAEKLKEPSSFLPRNRWKPVDTTETRLPGNRKEGEV